jgi:hypothetical protein
VNLPRVHFNKRMAPFGSSGKHMLRRAIWPLWEGPAASNCRTVLLGLRLENELLALYPADCRLRTGVRT